MFENNLDVQVIFSRGLSLHCRPFMGDKGLANGRIDLAGKFAILYVSSKTPTAYTIAELYAAEFR
jgi:hypothetical protein